MRRCTSTIIANTLLTSAALTSTALRFFHNGPPRGGNGQNQNQQREQMMRQQMMQQQQQQGGRRPPQQQQQDFYDDDPRSAPMPPQRRAGGGGSPMSRQQEQEEMMMMQQQRQRQQMMQQQQQQGGRRAPPAQQQQQDYEPMEEEEGVMESDEQDQTPPEPPKRPEEQKLVAVEENVDGTGVTVLKMKNKPVNSLSIELLSEINAWMLWLGAAEGVKGVVLSSDLPLVFSAGLDLKEFVDAKPDTFKVYWRTFQETYLILHTFPRPLIAAINGNSPAGGCILSLCCDHRIMARHPAGKEDKPYRIGLNETKLGLVAPPWCMQSLAYVIGQRKAERMLCLGETPTAVEAEALGLVDVVCDEADVLPNAIKEAAKMSTVNEEARWMTKDMMRRPLVELFASPEDREYDADFFASLATAEPVQQSLKAYVEKLGGGKKQ